MTAQKNLGDRQRCLLLFIDPFSFSYPLLSFLLPLSSLEQMGGWPCGRARELGPASAVAAERAARSGGAGGGGAHGLDQAVDDLCLQAFFASPKLLETPQPSSLRNAAPPQRSKADGPTGKPRTSGRAGGAERSRSKRKYVLYLCIYLSGISVLDK